MNIFKKRRKPNPDEVDCKFADSCSCTHAAKTSHCEKCKWYFWVDSGCGHCRALPEPFLTAWCRDPCSFYKPRRT